MVIYLDWTAYVNKLNRGSDDWRNSVIKAHQIKANMNGDNFCANCNNYYHMLEEILKALRVFDGIKLTISKALLTMKNLEKYVFILRNHPFNLAHNLAISVNKDFYSQWQMMTTET